MIMLMIMLIIINHIRTCDTAVAVLGVISAHHLKREINDNNRIYLMKYNNNATRRNP